MSISRSILKLTVSQHVVLLCLVFLGISHVHADPNGSTTECEFKKSAPEKFVNAAQMAFKTQQFLQSLASQPKVILLGRAGSDSPEKRFKRKVTNTWNYTHAGLAFKNHPSGQWTIVHLLNNCANQSAIYQESMMKFFLDDPYAYRTVIAVPSVKLQLALQEIVVKQQRASMTFQHSQYSSISWPFSLERQNSNEYILDTLVAGIAKIRGEHKVMNRHNAKQYLLQTELKSWVQPELVKVKALENLGMLFGIGPDNVTLSDHPGAARRKGMLEMVSVGTLIQFLENAEHLASVEEVKL